MARGSTVRTETISLGGSEMRIIFRFTIVAVALAALSVAAFALEGHVQASSAAVTPATPATPPPNETPEPEPKWHHQSVATAAANPDGLHPSGDLVEISIANQRLTAWRDGRIVYRFMISTGRPGYQTPTGHYSVIAKNPNAWSAKWSVWMPWAMNWYGNYFIHQLPHNPGSSENIGASRLGHSDSHGCVRVNVGDAEKLFHWTAVGTPVWVH